MMEVADEQPGTDELVVNPNPNGGVFDGFCTANKNTHNNTVINPTASPRIHQNVYLRDDLFSM